MTPNYIVALTYAAHGVRIIPAREAGSTGGPAKSPYVRGGFKSATTDTDQIGRWWCSWPFAMIGLPCRANGIIALDADRHGDQDGVAEAIGLFERSGFDPATIPVVITPRDGRHFIFRRPIDLGETKGNIAPAIDVRDNAYVIAAGSVMATGRHYQLSAGTVTTLAAAIAAQSLPALPSTLCALVAKPVAFPHQPMERPAASSTQHAGDLRPRLAGLIRAVAMARPGHRNATLYWAACRSGELIKGGLLSPAVAEAALVEAGLLGGLTAREALATVRSGFSTSALGSDHGR